MMMVFDADELQDVKIQQHVTITRTQRMMMILVFVDGICETCSGGPMEQVL